MNDIEKYYFECRCHFEEHTLRFSYISDPDDFGLYACIFLDTEGFFKRLWLAIKYIFGYKSRYGHFGNWLLEDDDIDLFQIMLDTYKSDLKKLRNQENSI